MCVRCVLLCVSVEELLFFVINATATTVMYSISGLGSSGLGSSGLGSSGLGSAGLGSSGLGSSGRSEEQTAELQLVGNLVCRLQLARK